MVSKVGIRAYPGFSTRPAAPRHGMGYTLFMQGREIWIVKLRGCDSLNESELLRGQTLLVSSTDRPELEDEDDFLVQVCFDVSSTWFLTKANDAGTSAPMIFGNELWRLTALSAHLLLTLPFLDHSKKTLEPECDLQDLIECDVVLQEDGLLIGKVLDVYDGTGSVIHTPAHASQLCPQP